MIPWLRRFINEDIWKQRLSDIPRLKALALRLVRILVLAVKGFDADRCSLQASALTFYLLLSIVPVIALAVGIAKGFGFERVIENQIAERFALQSGVSTFILRFVHAFLEEARGGLFAGFGVATLLWTVVSALGNIEKVLNGIWGITRGRGLGRKFSDYLSMVLVGTVFLIISGSLTVSLTTGAKTLASRFAFFSTAEPLVMLFLGFLPYLAAWILFSFMYLFIPNTKIVPAAGITGGIIAGTAYQVLQWIYVHFQVGAANYSAIYGSFAALPLFIVWAQLSWSIFLFGAEVSHATANAETYGFYPEYDRIRIVDCRVLMLRLLQFLAGQFEKGEQPLDVISLSRALQIPQQIVQHDLLVLHGLGLISETLDETTGEAAYQLKKDVSGFTVFSAVDILEQSGRSIPETGSEEIRKIRAALELLREAERLSAGNVPLKDI